MGHVNPELLDEFLQSISYPLFCYDRKAEDLIFDYDKKEQKVGLYIDGVFMQWVSNEIWAKFSL